MDQWNVAHGGLDSPGEIDISDAAASIIHRRQPELAC